MEVERLSIPKRKVSLPIEDTDRKKKRPMDGQKVTRAEEPVEYQKVPLKARDNPEAAKTQQNRKTARLT